TNAQPGFRKGKSCVTNLLNFYSRVIDEVQERDGWVDCVYLDLKKAFDKVPHRRLIWKLENFGGVKERLLEWMKDYLVGRQMSTVVRGVKSTWKEVTSGVPQGSVLGPIMFVVYVNDMVQGVESYISLFADDAKIMKKIEDTGSQEGLQKDLNKIYKWSREWEMEFNAKKCKVLEMGKSRRRPKGKYSMGGEVLQEATEEKDLGVTIQDSLSPEKHINRITGMAYKMVVNMRMAFHYLDEEMVKTLIKSFIRPQLEYAAVVWAPHKKKHNMKLERIQRAATKMSSSLAELTYEERLERLGLTTLEERRKRGDLITAYKYIKKFECTDRENFLARDEGELRGHDLKLKKTRCRKDIKKYSFPYRCVDEWNRLDREIVEAESIHSFKV
ncbi:MAG: reverse transcriptase family protein, partial [Gammaproteobacteria bacterium]|nr:reverse transcriptase family protein [Gammaproteobacteria bacterium]